MEIPINQGYYVSPSNPLVKMECTNYYLNIPQTPTALSKGALFRTPGAEEIITSGVTGVGRGTHKFQKNDWLFHVTGNKLIKRTSINSVNVVAGTITGTGQVSMADNGIILAIIVPGVTGYFYNIETDTLTEITDPVFVDFGLIGGGVTSVVSHDNRFIYTTNEEFFIGSLVTTNNGTDFNALDFEDAESSNDPIVRAMKTSNELYIFNAETTEVYKNVGGEDFPYRRIPGATIDRGLVARFGIALNNGQFYFLGSGPFEQPLIARTTTGNSEKISTTAIDSLIQSYTDFELSNVVAWTYAADGADFIGFNLPNETIVFDLFASALAGNPIWHIRQSNNTKYRVNSCQSLFGTTIVDDNIDGRIGKLQRNIVTEYGTNIDRTFSTMYINNGMKSFITRSVDLTTTRGVGAALNNPIPPTYNAGIEMSYSIDSGNTFTSLGNVTFGNAGEFLTKQQWRKLGRAEQTIMFRFTTNAAVPFDIQRLDCEVG